MKLYASGMCSAKLGPQRCVCGLEWVILYITNIFLLLFSAGFRCLHGSVSVVVIDNDAHPGAFHIHELCFTLIMLCPCCVLSGIQVRIKYVHPDKMSAAPGSKVDRPAASHHIIYIYI